MIRVTRVRRRARSLVLRALVNERMPPWLPWHGSLKVEAARRGQGQTHRQDFDKIF